MADENSNEQILAPILLEAGDDEGGVLWGLLGKFLVVSGGIPRLV
jgi:hypothetical protein